MICVGAYPLLALIVLTRAIAHFCSISDDETGGEEVVILWLTTVWAVWFIVSLFLSRSVMGSAWWALLYLVAGAAVTVMLSRFPLAVKTLVFLIFAQ